MRGGPGLLLFCLICAVIFYTLVGLHFTFRIPW